MTLPHSLAFGAAWLILLGGWLAAGLSLGPGAPARMAAAGGSQTAIVAEASGGSRAGAAVEAAP